MTKSSEKSKKVIVYIDGFNLYNGLCDKGWRKFLWLDLQKFSEALLVEGQHLVIAKYYTTRISHPFEKQKRQSIFIDALNTLKKLDITYGNFQKDHVVCQRCDALVYYDVEKQTDVNIASDMLTDAYENKYDIAILVSGDSDLCAPIKQIRRLFPDKIVIVDFPPMRESFELEQLASNAQPIFRRIFRENQLPLKITLADGHILEKPVEWS
jgi:hypothetical protein